MDAQNISEQALVQRINRVLKKDMQVLKKTRGERTRMDVGDYYIIDYYRNIHLESFVDLQELGRRLKVMETNERLHAQ